MAHPDDLTSQRFAWLRSGFDIEGWVGALAAWLAGILLGIVWAPLFWIGFACAVIILLATRTAERVPPMSEDVLIAPCDGTIVSVGGASLPNALRLEGGDWTRVRISSAPVTSNGVHAPMGGEIDHIISEAGDPSAVVAMRPDAPGLAVAYIALTSGGRQVGLRIAAGGFGPRLEIDVESGDAVRAGRHIGTRRLGGWCDVYIPAGAETAVSAGQTLVGAETVLARFTGGVEDIAAPFEAEEEVEQTAPAAPQTAPAVPIGDIDAGDEEMLDELAGAEEVASEDETPAPSAGDEVAEDEDDVSEMFAKLRKEAEKARDESGD
ncbi:MAG: phosphatidylserine decarboxylase [Pseudomonadota bacterium]